MSLKIGIQLYSVKNTIAQKPYEVLRQIAETGYRYIEAANHNAANDPGVGFGMPARELKQSLDDLGLQITDSALKGHLICGRATFIHAEKLKIAAEIKDIEFALILPIH